MKLFLKSFLVLLFLAGFLGAVKFRCDYSYSNIGWLKYHEVPAKWRDARLRCRFEGGILASPTTTELKAAMMNTIRDVDVFTGIHDIVSNGNYYSIDGIPLDAISHKWADNEPDNKNNAENCISMSSEGNFSDVSCNEPRPYICYRAISSEGTNFCGTIDSEYHFEQRTGKCYKFHTVPRQFKRAHFVCSAEGGHLAIINSVTESHVIRDLFAKYPANKMVGSFWKDVAYVGFHNYGESADWTTVHGQSLQEAGFAQFSGGEPNNATEGEYCGSVYRNGYLNDLWCEKHFAFICEKDPNYPAVCDSANFNEANTVQTA